MAMSVWDGKHFTLHNIVLSMNNAFLTMGYEREEKTPE